MIDTNCLGLVSLTRAVLPGMIERGRGHVVNIGSVAGTYPYPGGNVYGATKAFVRQFTLNLKADLLGTPAPRHGDRARPWPRPSSRLVRLEDAEKARAVYQGMQPLTAGDIAEAVAWCVTLPPHVNVNRLELMPTQQAFSPFAVHRKS